MFIDYIQAITLAIRANQNSPLDKKECSKYTSKIVNAREHRSIWLDFGRCTEKTKAIQELCRNNSNYLGITKIRNVKSLHHFSTVSEDLKAEIVFIDEPFMFTENNLEYLYEIFPEYTIFIHLGRPRYVKNQSCKCKN